MAYLVTGFDLNRVGSMSCVVDDGTDDGTATVTVARYCHRDLTSLSARLGSGNYDDFATALDAALTAVLTTHGATVSVNLATGVYTLGVNASASPNFDFTSGAGQRLAQALGFHASGGSVGAGTIGGTDYACTLSGATSYTSNVKPYYWIELARDGMTSWSRPYDVAGQTKHVSTTKGNGYGIGPTTKTQHVDLKLAFQGLASVFSQESTTEVPWTIEDLMQHVGAWEPIALSTTADEFVFTDREGGDFTDERRTPQWNSYHAYWTIDVRGQFVGWL